MNRAAVVRGGLDAPRTTGMAPGSRAAAQPPARRLAARRAAVVAASVALLLFTVLLSLRLGSRVVPWHDAIAALTSWHGGFLGDSAWARSCRASHACMASTDNEIVVRQIRLPRTVVGLGVGMALGVSGALMQGMTRNPLADPGLLGVNAGAALAIDLAVLCGIDSVEGYIWFAFLAAAITALLVYVLGSVGGGATPMKLALAGAIVSTFIGSVLTMVGLLSPSLSIIGGYWQAGTIAGRSMAAFWSVSPFMAVGLVVALGCGRRLNGLALGDDVARSLGQRVGVSRGIAAVAAVLLAGTAVAIAGPIAFVGLLVPHVARFLVGNDYTWALPVCALLGPVVLLLADVAGRVVDRPGEVGAGIMMGLLGAPVFVFLARRRGSAGL